MTKPLLGRSLDRLEDERFVRGRGRYIADLVTSGALHGVVVRSPHAHARVVSIGGAVTEIIYALGEEHRLVAVDTTSLYPEAAGVGRIEGRLTVGPGLTDVVAEVARHCSALAKVMVLEKCPRSSLFVVRRTTSTR